MSAPKLFISYAHADGETIVRQFWEGLNAFLNTPERQWDKWDDKQILVGDDWNKTISEAQEQKCNCCLLLVSDLFAKSTYIRNKEWPKSLARYEKDGIVFFPVVFGVLGSGLAGLPQELADFQVYWPTVSDLFLVPPANVPFPDQVRLGYKDAKEQDATRERFLAGLAKQMNARFDEYLRVQAAKAQVVSPIGYPINAAQFVTNVSDDGTFAKAIFGSFSYEKRYQDSKSKAHYFARQADVKLDERMRQKEWVLVVGHPLAGKTRAIFEAIKRLMSSGKRVAVWPFKVPEQSDQPLSLPTFPDADYRIVWIDDIDARFRDLARHGYGAVDINQFLERIVDAGAILAATVRTGPTYRDFRHLFGLDDHLWDKLEAIPIPRLEGVEGEGFSAWYSDCFHESLPDKFDHHPGSLFLDLEAMRGRWEGMDRIARQHGLKVDVENAKDIMRALHVFYVMEAYRPGGEFREDDIRFYLRRMAEKTQTSTAMGAGFAKALSSLKSSGKDWEKMIELLSQDQFHLGFLRQAGNSLFTETAYLDYIVAPGTNKNIAQTVAENFSPDERSALGLMVTRYNFGDVFREYRLSNKKELDRLARKLESLGLEREIVIWNHVLHLCPSLALALNAMEMLKLPGNRPDVVTYSMLLNKATTLVEGRAVLVEMRGDEVQPNAITYNTLLDKATTLEEGRAVLGEMRGDAVQPDVVTYNTLLDKATTLEEGRAVLGEMRGDAVQPDVVTYSTLLDKAKTLEESRAVLVEMRGDEVKPNVVTYSTLLDKAKTLEEGRAVLAEMRDDEVQPNVITYNTLLGKAKTLEEGRAVLAEMRGDAVQPNVITYNTLLDKATTLAEGRTVLVEMRDAEVKPNVVTYSTLLDKATTLEEGRAVLAEMRDDAVQPNVVTYSTLLDKTNTLEEHRAVLVEMRADEVQPNVITYNTLVSKAEDFTAAKGWVEQMGQHGIGPNYMTITALFSKDLTEVCAEELLSWYWVQEYRPSAPLQAAISSYRKAERVGEAFRIALHYPNLEAVQKLYRDLPTDTRNYLLGVLEDQPGHPDVHYALGVALMEWNANTEAETYLQAALETTTHKNRISDIKARLGKINQHQQ